MKFSVNNLCQWVNPKISPQSLADQLTMAGLEVDEVLPVAAEFSGVVVGQVLKKDKHPEADRLSLCQVDVGAGEPVDIICGASNVKANMKVAVAKIGAVLPGDFKIKKAKLRGISSHGMICSESELGLAEESSGIMPLAHDAPIGKDIRDYLNLDDVSIDIDLTPNRGDCASLCGIAREVAVLNKLELKTPNFSSAKKTEINDKISVSVSEPEACPRYLARIVKNIDAKAKTPLYIQEDLRRAGMRSISVVVDVTNYVMLQLGQPMHAFDCAKVSSGIQVRFAKKDETLILLDGKTIDLQARTLLIADNTKALAIAGIMGGEHSGVTDNTTDIILESAFFNPLHIAKRARSYGIQTDSSYRFERGVDPAITEKAMEMATSLIIDIAGGKAGPIVEKTADKHLPVRDPILLRFERIKAILGIELDHAEVKRIFQALDFDVELNDNASLNITPPSFRFDVCIEEDLLEELARIVGYDNIPQQPIWLDVKPHSQEKSQLASYKEILINRGFQEAITYSFIDPKINEQFFADTPVMQLINPISQELSIMRQSLLPGLLKAIKYNVARSERRLRFFEVGHCFHGVNEKLIETNTLGALITGEKTRTNWQGNAPVNFYDLKGDLEAMLSLNIKASQLRFLPSDELSYFHPGQSARICIDGKAVGMIGAIHPELLAEIGIKQKVFAFELNFNSNYRPRVKKYSALSKYPSISRDIALVLEGETTSQMVQDCIVQSAGQLLRKITVFDVYAGEAIEKGKKSLAINLIFQDFLRTLKDDEVSQLVDKIITDLQTQLEAQLRE